MPNSSASENKRSKDSVANVLIVAVSLCLVCSLLVSTAAVRLKPIQERNKEVDRKINILNAAGLYDEARDIDELFEQVEVRVVDLSTGKFVDYIDPQSYDLVKVLKDPELSQPVAADEDIARIRRQEKYALVYLVMEGDDIENFILPVRGAGLYSTLYGFLALKADGATIQGLSFYEQGETPGLGGEIVNPKWRAKWQDKRVYDRTGVTRIEVVKGPIDSSKPEAIHQVDAIAGATLTSRGVNNLMRFWLGDSGYKAMLEQVSSREG